MDVQWLCRTAPHWMQYAGNLASPLTCSCSTGKNVDPAPRLGSRVEPALVMGTSMSWLKSKSTGVLTPALLCRGGTNEELMPFSTSPWPLAAVGRAGNGVMRIDLALPTVSYSTQEKEPCTWYG